MQQACKHHVHLAQHQHKGETKLYAECLVAQIDHQLIRAYLDAQSMGPRCQSLNPTYRAIPTSLLTVVGIPPVRQPTDSKLPTGLLALQPTQQICCYRSVFSEELEDPATAVQLSVQHVLARNSFTYKIPRNCTLHIETVRDQVSTTDLMLPQYVQKENGTTYIPLQPTTAFIIELFQVWRETTFAGLEVKSKSPQKEAVFGVRVSILPQSKTPQDLTQTIQELLKFIDLLVYG